MNINLYLPVFLLITINIFVDSQNTTGGEVVASGQPTAASNGTGTIEGMFHCLRPLQSCVGANSTCDEGSGKCVCDTGDEGFDCSVNSSQKITANCQCMNGGTCVDKGSGSVCFCPSAFIGQNCQTPRIIPKCNPDSVEVTISPFTDTGATFGGLMYVLGNEETPECVLGYSHQDSGNAVYNKVIKYDMCGGAATSNDTNGDTVKSFTIVLQYDSLFVTVTDQEFVFDCTMKKSDSNIQWETTDLASKQNSRNIQQQRIAAELRPVEVTFKHGVTGEPLTGPQVIGTPVRMCFVFNGGVVYDSFQVVQVTAHNGLTGTRAKSFDFVVGGCVNPQAGSVGQGKKIVTAFSGNNTSEVCVTFKLFKLPYSNQVAFRNVMKICKGSNGCNTTTCTPNEFPKLGRKRRSIEEYLLDENENFLNKYEEMGNRGITVWIPGQKIITADDYLYNEEPENCYHNIWFVVSMVSLLLVALLGVTLVALLCVRRKQRRAWNVKTVTEPSTQQGYDVKYKY